MRGLLPHSPACPHLCLLRWQPAPSLLAVCPLHLTALLPRVYALIPAVSALSVPPSHVVPASCAASAPCAHVLLLLGRFRVHIPQIRHDLTSPRVLTMEFVDGVQVRASITRSSSQEVASQGVVSSESQGELSCGDVVRVQDGVQSTLQAALMPPPSAPV